MRFWPGLTGTIALCSPLHYKEASSAVVDPEIAGYNCFTGVEDPNLDDGFLAGCFGVCWRALALALCMAIPYKLLNFQTYVYSAILLTLLELLKHG